MESRSPTYNSWQAMKKRCLNKKHKGYKDYGEKGITICDECRFSSNFEPISERAISDGS